MVTERLSFTELEYDNYYLLKIYSDLDVDNSKVLKEKIFFLFEDGIIDIVFDMENVDYINSYGLGMLRSLQREANDRGGNISLLHINLKVKNVIQMVGLDEVFEIYENIDELRKKWNK